MDLHHLHTFIVVAEEQNVTRAAERLFTTPPSVSMHIKMLEWREQTVNATWVDLARLPWINSSHYCPYQTIIDDIFTRARLSYNRAVEAGDEAIKFDLVSSGLGLALLERIEAEEGSRSNKMLIWEPDDMLQTDLSFISHASRRQDPLIKALIEAVCEGWDVTLSD
jgi:DNA-binding transcriptional LysR family regulator